MSKNRKGVILILAFIILVTITVIVSAFLFMTTYRFRGMGAEITWQKAFWIAEAGVQQAVYRLKTESAYRDNPTNIPSTNLGEGTYSVSVTKSGKMYTIFSTGTVAGSRRTSGAVYYFGSLFSHALFAGGSGGGGLYAVQMSGQAMTDSYDSSLGLYNVNGNIGNNGDVATNADIQTTGNSVSIGGDASTGPSGTFNNQSLVSGNIDHTINASLVPVVVPAALTALSSGGDVTATASISAGNYKYNKFDLKSSDILTITGPAQIYLTGDSNSLVMGGQSQIVISGTQPVIFFIDGNVDMAGGGVTNNSSLPANFQLYGTGSSGQNISVTLTGGSNYFGTIYAPTGNLTLKGQGNMFGAYIGDTVNFSGQAAIHYDQNLINLESSVIPTSNTIYERDWQEIVPAL